MLSSRSGSSNLIFDPIRETIDSFLITTLKVFFSNNNFINSIQKDLNKCRHPQNQPCIISSLQASIDQYKKGLIINTLPLRQSLAALYQNERKFTLDSADWDIIETMSIILNAIHIKAIDFPCGIQNNDILSISCNEACPFHMIFYLGVDENYTCECGNENSNPWDNTNMCQYFNINEIFEDYNHEVSQNMSKLPNFIIKEKGIACNSPSFLNKIVNKIEERLSNATSDSCYLDNCHINRSKITFRLTKCPEIYLINLIWENNNPLYIQVMLATVSISSTIMIDEIYGIGPKIRYNLKGIVFYRNSFYDYAYRNDDKWKFSGLHENSGWYELLQEITVLKYLPICLVYEKTPLNQPYSFDVKIHKIMFVEKLAGECEEYETVYGSRVISTEKKVSGLFEKIKKNNVEKQKNPDLRSLYMKSNVINEVSLPVSKKIQRPQTDSSFPSIIDVKSSSVLKEEKKVQQNSSYNQKPVSEPMLNILRVNSIIKNPSSVIEKNPLSSVIEKKSHSSVIEKKSLSYDIEKKPPSPIKKIWKCKCGSENIDSWEVCSKCYQLKPGVEGWVCEFCKTKNDSEFLVSCSVCEETNQKAFFSDPNSDEIIKSFDLQNKPKAPIKFYDDYEPSPVEEKKQKAQKLENPNKKPLEFFRIEKKNNTWDCDCGSSNINEWEICEKCYKTKPKLRDWDCKFCKAKNPPENINRCYKCYNTKNSISGKNQEYSLCKKCKTENRIYADTCESCEKIKDQDYDSIEKNNKSEKLEEINADIWECPKCETKNSIEKNKCFYCKLVNPYIVPKKYQNLEEKVKIETWECKCGKINNQIKMFCGKCYEKKK
ncbi:hypothetical protein SteCoe_24982 [Stentor coeruleus]|uniref:RanBP2-type domain-containing protein n=1 Tax=Stentor coeruleus TaxID=5963 RepID=A0A1R2BGB0_9CILI|nr:hypothetical protein SteCoe_24982 [Stentor coeruleus]